MKQLQQAGFTLVEVLVTLAIVAILAAYAAPNISAMIEKNRIRTHLNSFVSSLLLARSEAALRNVNVVVCASKVNSYSGEDLYCDSSADDFSRGWLVFVDTNGDGRRNPFVDTTGDGFGDGPDPEILLSISESLGDNQDAGRLMISADRSGFERLVSFSSLGHVAGENEARVSNPITYIVHKANQSDTALAKMTLGSTGRPYIACVGKGSC